MKILAVNIFTGLIIISTILVIPACDPHATTLPLKRQAEIKPQWGASEIEIIAPDSITHEFQILWDQSIPMGGYVHRTDPDSQSTLNLINHSLKSARLKTAYGGRESSLSCLGVTYSITSVNCDSGMLRDFFYGNESRLDQGIEYVIEGLKSGKFKGAALVSDLIATTRDVTGPLALLPYLSNSVMNAHYNSGKIDMAIIGIRMDYWGVQKGPCQMIQGPLGCEFNDFEDRYQLLNTRVKRPFYVLIMGWRLEGQTSENNSVNNMISWFAKDLEAMGLEIEYENLTQGQLESRNSFFWYPAREDNTTTGYEIVGLNEDGYYCKDNDAHSLVGGFSDSLISIMNIELSGFENLFRASMSEINSAQVNLEVNCKTLNQEKKSQELCDNPSKLMGRIEYQGQSDWADWSSILHESNLTPGIDPFINGLRPSHYQAVIDPAPPLDNCKSQ